MAAKIGKLLFLKMRFEDKLTNPESGATLVELHYLPSLEYFALLEKFDPVILEACENYQKQSYRNRCYIRGANKIETLVVPVKKSGNKTPVRDVRIAYSERWDKEHWRALASAYGKAPYFEYFADLIKVIYEKKFTFLFDLNYSLLSLCLDIIGMKKTVSFTSEYITSPREAFDARSKIHPKKNFAKNSFYKPQPYYQVFGKVFDENLSIIDLIFCEGNYAKSIIKNSTVG